MDPGGRLPEPHDACGAVAITGAGVVSPIGIGRRQFWEALCAGTSGITEYPGASRCAAARVTSFSVREIVTSPHLRRMDRLSGMIVAAGRLALDDARLDQTALHPERLGIVVGSAFGNVNESVHYLERVFTKGPTLASPLTFPNLVLNAPASYAGMVFGCTGVNLTVSQGEASGEQAIALGCDLVRTGRADVVLVGGGDELADIVLSAYRRLHALSGQRGGPVWCSPYDAERNGVVLGEGAAMLVLESVARARRRGATVYAEIEDHLGFGVPAPLHDWPATASAAIAPLRRFLARRGAGTRADLVCGGANSSRRLDACEIELVARLFGEAAPGVTLTSIKGAVGEFGAAGALATVAACLALHGGVVPPLCNLRRPVAPELRFAARTAQPQRLQRALVLSIARGGAGVALWLRRAAE